MFLVDSYLSSFAGAAMVIGFALVVLPYVSRTNVWMRSFLLGVTAILAWRYMLWRFTETIPPFSFTLDAVTSWIFAIVEGVSMLSSTSAYLFLTRHKDRSLEADQNLSWWGDKSPPRVDLYIATYNEEQEVLERTLAGAQALAYPHVRVFVLDDGRRDWLTEVCRRYGAEHRTRPDNAHAKAGNINYTLRQRLNDEDAPDFIAVLDADFVPHRNFVSRALALFHNPRVGLVQTPQHFFNPDPVQHNLKIADAYPDEQRFFFENIEPSRDAWGIAVCCGTSSMIRTEALMQIGGFPTESVTEDFLVTIRLDTFGWKTVYLNEALTEGLAPEGLQEYMVQRGRWCLGMMEIVRNVYNPLGVNRLPLMQRLSLLDSVLYWTSTFPFRLISLACPILYWYFGIIVVNAAIPEITAYFVPYYVAVLVSLNWISRGKIIPVLNDVSQLLAAWPITRAVIMGLFTKGPHKFRVTAKGGDRTKTVVQWPLMRPFLILFGITILGMVLPLFSENAFLHVGRAGDGIRVILFWTFYNLVVLGVTMLACIERPRVNRPQRGSFEMAYLNSGHTRLNCWLLELAVDRARLRGADGLDVGDLGVIALNDVGEISIRVTEKLHDGYHLSLRPTADQRIAILRKLHTADAVPGTSRGDLSGMIRGWVRTMALEKNS